jgi:hypothetical protein
VATAAADDRRGARGRWIAGLIVSAVVLVVLGKGERADPARASTMAQPSTEALAGPAQASTMVQRPTEALVIPPPILTLDPRLYPDPEPNKATKAHHADAGTVWAERGEGVPSGNCKPGLY